MEPGGHEPQMIDDDDRHAHVGRQVPEQPNIGVKAAGRTAHANDRKSSLGHTRVVRVEAGDGRHGSLSAMRSQGRGLASFRSMRAFASGNVDCKFLYRSIGRH